MKLNKYFLIFIFGLIYVVFAPPRQGKTFFCTKKALEALKKGNEKVFTNYPIRLEYLTNKQKIKNIFLWLFRKKLIKPKILSSFVWKREYMKDNIYDSLIIWDEAYRDLSSREWKTFTKDDHTWFATNGHNLNDIYVIAQNYNRVDIVIREMANYFIYIKKKMFLWHFFLYFIAEFYISEDDFRMRKRDADACFFRQRFLKSKEVMNAYDTHYWRNYKQQKEYITWDEYLKNEIPSIPSSGLPDEQGGILPIPKVEIMGLIQS